MHRSQNICYILIPSYFEYLLNTFFGITKILLIEYGFFQRTISLHNLQKMKIQIMFYEKHYGYK